MTYTRDLLAVAGGLLSIGSGARVAGCVAEGCPRLLRDSLQPQLTTKGHPHSSKYNAVPTFSYLGVNQHLQP